MKLDAREGSGLVLNEFGDTARRRCSSPSRGAQQAKAGQLLLAATATARRLLAHRAGYRQ